MNGLDRGRVFTVGVPNLIWAYKGVLLLVSFHGLSRLSIREELRISVVGTVLLSVSLIV